MQLCSRVFTFTRNHSFTRINCQWRFRSLRWVWLLILLHGIPRKNRIWMATTSIPRHLAHLMIKNFQQITEIIPVHLSFSCCLACFFEFRVIFAREFYFVQCMPFLLHLYFYTQEASNISMFISKRSGCALNLYRALIFALRFCFELCTSMHGTMHALLASQPWTDHISSGPITTTYGQVWWTSTSNDIPKEVVDRFRGKAIAIVGFVSIFFYISLRDYEY